MSDSHAGYELIQNLSFAAVFLWLWVRANWRREDCDHHWRAHYENLDAHGDIKDRISALESWRVDHVNGED